MKTNFIEKLAVISVLAMGFFGVMLMIAIALPNIPILGYIALTGFTISFLIICGCITISTSLDK